MDIKKMSIDEKIGQRFIFGVNDIDVEPIIDLIKKCHIGGIVLYKRNYRSYDDMLKVIKKFKEANKTNDIPLFISIDQEGGVVNRIPSEIHNLKNIYEVTKTDINNVTEYADIIGKILAQSGINMNLSPVLDIYNNSKSKALEKRCFYGDEKVVTECGRKYVKELDKNGIISVIKHFPGHGASMMDSHFFVPYIHNYEAVLNNHIKPFEVLLRDAPSVMVGHLVIRKLTGMKPATMATDFSTKYIREKYNYDGIVMTDEINMLKKHLSYRFNYIDKMLKSDNDIILVKIKDANEGYKIIKKYKKILSNNDELQKLDRHVERILKIKDKYNINDNTDYQGIDIDKVNKRIDKINNIFKEK